jgi:DNA-binding MarR family transcriptional regulator
MRNLKELPIPEQSLEMNGNGAATIVALGAPAGNVSDLSRAFVEVLPRAMWSIRAGVRQAAGENFTMPQFRVLTQLLKRSSTNGELAELMGVSVPAMSRMVDGLVEMGFVVRVPVHNDRRQIKLELGPEGRRKFRRLQKHIHGVFVDRFGALSPDRLDALESGLKVFEELFPGN